MGWTVNITYTMSAQSTVVERCLNDIFTMKKPNLVKNQSAHFTFKISTNHVIYAPRPRYRYRYRILLRVSKNCNKHEFHVTSSS